MRKLMVLGMLFGLGEGLLVGQVDRVQGCPVEFRAAVSSRVVVRSVGRGGGVAEMGPLLELRFGDGERRVVAASVVVRGFSSDGRVLPVTGGPGEAVREQRERFELRTMGEERLGRREVTLRETQVVRWAELAEVRYADGSVWRQTAGKSCRAVPSGFHLVGAE